MLLHNITEKLKPGGYFVGTIPDANLIVYDHLTLSFLVSLIFYIENELEKAPI